MPSENTFKQHAESARSALKNFDAIRQLDAPGPVKTAFDELVAIISDFHNFVPFFVNHPLFLEVPPLAYTALEDFLSKNTTFERPALYARVTGLNTRIKESISSAKKGMGCSLILFY
jgi:hypothetical protein